MILEALSKEAQCPGDHCQGLRLMLLAVCPVIATGHVNQNLHPAERIFMQTKIKARTSCTAHRSAADSVQEALYKASLTIAFQACLIAAILILPSKAAGTKRGGQWQIPLRC